MVKEYRASPFVNRITSLMARMGVGRTEVLTTTGRKSGKSREVPVSPIVHEGVEYVVSPYGEVAWVGNVRANPEATLRLGSKERRVRLNEVDGEAAAPIVAAYHAKESFARPYMDVPENPTITDFAAHAARFPVFRVVQD